MEAGGCKSVEDGAGAAPSDRGVVEGRGPKTITEVGDGEAAEMTSVAVRCGGGGDSAAVACAWMMALHGGGGVGRAYRARGRRLRRRRCGGCDGMAADGRSDEAMEERPRAPRGERFP